MRHWLHHGCTLQASTPLIVPDIYSVGFEKVLAGTGAVAVPLVNAGEAWLRITGDLC
jgi:hypothetical protein